MANFNLQEDYVLQKGPLSDQELLLKDFLLRDTYYKVPDISIGGILGGATTGGASTAPTPTPTPPATTQTGGATISLLGTVKPGDLITADFMNSVVVTVNQLITYLRNQSAVSAAPTPTPSPAPTPSASGAGIAGLLKDVTFTTASEADKVTVTFPAENVDKGDFSDIVIGNTRVDPGDLVKVDGGYSFQIDKAAYTSGMDVRAVSKGGAAAQQVMTLFR